MNNAIELTTTHTAKSTTSSKVRQLTIGLFISLITLVVVIGGIELAGYLWETRTAQGPLGWTLVASRRLDLARHGSEEQPYYLFEPNRDYLWEGIPVHINSRGFRTEEFDILKPPGTYRILNLGDSIAFGWEVRQEDTHGKILERELNAQRNEVRYEVINTGIPTWNLESERNFLLQEGLNYQPDLVILDITIVNDIFGRGPGISQESSFLQWLRDNTYGWPFLTTQARFLLSRRVGPEAIPVLNPPQRASAYYPLDPEDPAYDRIWDAVEAMHQASKVAGADFITVIFPTALQLNSAAHPDIPQRVLAQRAADADIPFVDLLPAYRQVCRTAPAGACEGYENLLFADVWMHPNALGHSIATEWIYKTIQPLIP